MGSPSSTTSPPRDSSFSSTPSQSSLQTREEEARPVLGGLKKSTGFHDGNLLQDRIVEEERRREEEKRREEERRKDEDRKRVEEKRREAEKRRRLEAEYEAKMKRIQNQHRAERESAESRMKSQMAAEEEKH